MVGRLVEQQQVGLPGQGAAEQRPALQPARQRAELRPGRQLQPLPQLLHPHLPLPVLLVPGVGPEPGGDDVVHRARHVRRHLLRQPGEDRPRLAEDLARVGFQLARDDAHQGGLARAVAAEQADAFARIDLEVDRFEDRGAAEVQADLEEGQERHEPFNVVGPPTRRNPGVYPASAVGLRVRPGID